MKKCLNCGEQITQKFCPNCSQKSSTSRITLRSFFHDLIDAIITLDSKFLRTVYALYKNPGKFIKEYLSGKRIRFASPLKFFFFVIALNIATSFILHKPAFEPVIIEKDNLGIYSTQIITILTDLVMMFLMFLFGFGLLLADRKKVYSYIENYCFLIYIISQSIITLIILQLILQPMDLLLRKSNEGLVWLVIFSIFYFWGHLNLYDEAFKRKILRTTVSYILGLVFLFLFIIILGNMLQLVIV